MGIKEVIAGIFGRGSAEAELTLEQLRAKFADAKRIELPVINWSEVRSEEGSKRPAVLMNTDGFSVRNVPEIHKGSGVLTVPAIYNGEAISLKTETSEVEPGHSFRFNLPSRRLLQGPAEVCMSVEGSTVDGIKQPPTKLVIAFDSSIRKA